MKRRASGVGSGPITRREFLALTAASAGALAAGCATNPVSGHKQLMLVSEAKEIELDREWAPHQFSADYGATQDEALNAYVSGVGGSMTGVTHRPNMPYSFRVVNSVVVNGYTFPAGSVGLCRGLLLDMESESQLAGVLGHELGHVSARHAGERMTKGMLASIAVAGLTAYVSYEEEKYADLAAGLGMIGSTLLLARYSRGDEREADALGMEYMVRADHNPRGMVSLMDMFRKLHETKPGIVEVLFSTHPMSDERYNTAQKAVESRYADAAGRAENGERYMDQTVRLREMRGAIEAMQKGEEAMSEKRYGDAESLFGSALQQAPNDYAGLLMMAKCCLSEGKKESAANYVKRAKEVYPEEPQADHVMGMTNLQKGSFDAALSSFADYERKLPGNPNTVFLRATCLEQMGRRRDAAGEYLRYLNAAPGGEFAGQSRGRLSAWGVLP